jgi:hypothetical protein
MYVYLCMMCAYTCVYDVRARSCQKTLCALVITKYAESTHQPDKQVRQVELKLVPEIVSTLAYFRHCCTSCGHTVCVHVRVCACLCVSVCVLACVSLPPFVFMP